MSAGDIQSRLEGSYSNLVAKTFKVITRKKVFIPGKFVNANQQACVKCGLRANEGHLYPLEKQFIFIHKPAALIQFDEIESVEFQWYAGGQGSTRNFDLSVTLHSIPGNASSTREYTFSGIDKTNYAALYSFLSGKKIRIANHEGAGGVGGLDEQEPTDVGRGGMGGGRGGDMMDDEGEESSEDEDYDEDGKSKDGSDGSSGGGDSNDYDDDDDNDEDLGSVASDDSDIKQHRKAASATKTKTKTSEESPPDEEEEGVPGEGEVRRRNKEEEEGSKRSQAGQVGVHVLLHSEAIRDKGCQPGYIIRRNRQARRGGLEGAIRRQEGEARQGALQERDGQIFGAVR